MAKAFEPLILGVDTSKATLDVYRTDTEAVSSIPNEIAAIKAFVASLPAGTLVAIEATNVFHRAMVEMAVLAGLTVYVVDALRLKRYREATGGRAKTDARDAWLLARYLKHERNQLQPVVLRKAEEIRLWQLLNRRGKVVQECTTLKQSLRDLELGGKVIKELWQKLQAVLRTIEQEALKLIKRLGWQADVARLESIPGVGRLTAIALVTAMRRLPFKSADAFVAYLGLDVRVCDSGMFRGRGRLTKKGPSELRRLLFMAGRSARRTAETFTAYFDRQLERGKSRTAADVAVGRKLARIAFALVTKQDEYQPQPAR